MSQITTFFPTSSGPGSGTVTSVSGGVGINITGTPTINPTVNLNVPVVIANGGTNATSFTNTDGVIYYDGTRLVTTNTGTNGQILTISGGIPVFAANSGGTITLTADTGSATGDPILIAGGHDINTSASGTTLTVALNNTITLGDLSSVAGSAALTLTTGDIHVTAGGIFLPNTTNTNVAGVIYFNSTPFVQNYGTSNTFIGGAAGNTSLTVVSATDNTALGRLAMTSLTTGAQNTTSGSGAMQALNTGIGNSSFGFQSLDALTSGQHNSSFGSSALGALGTGSNNTAIGYQSLAEITGATSSNTAIGYQTGLNLDTGSNNIFVGTSAGTSYTTTESSNITIGNIGTITDNNVIRIGTQGSGTAQQSTCFIAGITGVTTSSSNMVTINTSTGQLGAATIPVSALAWSVITANQSAVVNNGYICNKASLLTLTLPTTSATGSIIEVTGMNTALGWKIAQNANQVIHFGNSNTTTGASGSLASTLTYDSIRIVCNVANLEWIVLSAQGNITVV